MASPPPHLKDEGGAGEEPPTAPASPTASTPAILAARAAPALPLHAPAQHTTKLQYVALEAPGPSGIKQCFRTVKQARRVPTLGPSTSAGAAPSTSTGRRADRGKRHVCNMCDKRFSSPGKLSQHQLSHTGELPYSCEFCDKRFNSKFKLGRHGLIHSEARAFACTVCGRTFNRKDHLNNHVRIHNPVKKVHMCERPGCRKQYTSALSYRKHVALHAAEEGSLRCEICGATFTTRADIIYHLKVHTGSRTVKSETDKKFTCTYCDRRFFTGKDVRRHLVVHTGRRDFLCPFCPQKFGRKDHLVRHVKNAHPDETWRSATASTSTEPPLPPDTPPEIAPIKQEHVPEPVTFIEFQLDPDQLAAALWRGAEGGEVTHAPGHRTRVPSSDIIVEMPSHDVKLELDEVKVEPLEEDPDSPRPGPSRDPPRPLLQYSDVVYLLPSSPYSAPASFSTSHLQLDPATLQLELGGDESPESAPLSPSVMSLLEYEEESPPELTVTEQPPTVLPTFTQAFHSAQSPKPPPQPPPQ